MCQLGIWDPAQSSPPTTRWRRAERFVLVVYLVYIRMITHFLPCCYQNPHVKHFLPFNSATGKVSAEVIVPGRPTWQQTMLRIADPEKSIPFYTDVMGMTLIDTLDFPQWNFKLFFLTTLPEGETYDLVPGTQEAHDYMWSIEGTALELTHNYGTEEESFEGYHPGNQEKDGFGHVAFNTDDVFAACKVLEEAGVEFKKKPDEGR